VSADHKRPLLAFVLVTIACMLIVVNAARSQAVRSVVHHGADRVAAGVRLALEDDDPAPVAAAAPRSFDRDDEPAARPRRLPAPTRSSAAPSSAVPSIVEAPERAVRAPRHLVRLAPATHLPRLVQAVARAGLRRAAAPADVAPRTHRAHHRLLRLAQDRSSGRTTADHRTSSGPEVRGQTQHRSHHRAHHRSHHRGGRHHHRR
jgi:hypothetical protein